MSLTLRDAREEDLAAVVAMLADDELGSTRERLAEPLDPGYTNAFSAIGADPNQRLIVAEADRNVVGTFQLSFLPGISHRGAWRGQIEAVRVAKHLRGHGFGEQMMRWAIDECRARGCRMVQLTTANSRTDAHRFYERLGFKPTHFGMKLVLDQ
jgi:ribosomal protein S18 acetylase RimI-like enzyme